MDDVSRGDRRGRVTGHRRDQQPAVGVDVLGDAGDDLAAG
jgi:hypothetical protein